MEQKALDQLQKLQDRGEIEKMASLLSIEDAIALFQHIAELPKQFEEKIQPLLSGLPDSVCCAIFPLLKPFAKNPITQHKMAQVMGKIKSNLSENQQKLEILAERIAHFPLSPILPEALSALQIDIQNAFEENAAQIELLSRMTEIAWFAERSDLVFELSTLKSLLIHLSYHLGLLPGLLLTRLQEVLGPLDEASNQEALRLLGYSYPEDFTPLFTALKIPYDIDKLENELQKRGLATVKDFKTHQIYTKEMLIAYLNNVH